MWVLPIASYMRGQMKYWRTLEAQLEVPEVGSLKIPLLTTRVRSDSHDILNIRQITPVYQICGLLPPYTSQAP